MAMDMIPWIEQRKQRILHGLTRRAPSRARLVGKPQREGYAARIRWGTLTLGILITIWVLALGTFLRPPGTSPGDGVGHIFGALFIAAGFIAAGFALLCWCTTAHITVAERVWAVPLDGEQARELAAWIKAYPAIRDICVKWGGSRPSATLHSADFLLIKAAGERLQELDKQLERHQLSQASADATLNAHVPGLVEEMRAASSARVLEVRTELAQAPPAARRL